MSEVAVMNKRLEPEVKIELGDLGERIIRVDFNCLALIEDKLGRPFTKMGNWQELQMKDMRSIAWAALVHEDPKLTERQVGEVLSMSNMNDVVSKFMQAMTIAVGGTTPAETPVPLPKAVEASPIPAAAQETAA